MRREGGQVRAAEAGRRGSVGHVEAFRMDGVGTSIVGRPRRLPADRRARPTYTLIWEEPSMPASQFDRKPTSCRGGRPCQGTPASALSSWPRTWIYELSAELNPMPQGPLRPSVGLRGHRYDDRFDRRW
ncbi:hypothetical protein CH302_28960 [Rhodococcus sp. 15-2388-1-1a]|nr:hypothetical protein CH302_28960 [Rhodococcus sp. 15-2388-1-1a]